MEFNKYEFEQEIKTALGYAIEIEHHCDEMDTDDIKEMCERIRFALTRTLNGIQAGKIRLQSA